MIIDIDRVEVIGKSKTLGRMLRIRRRGKKMCYFKPTIWYGVDCQSAGFDHRHNLDTPDELVKIIMLDFPTGTKVSA